MLVILHFSPFNDHEEHSRGQSIIVPVIHIFINTCWLTNHHLRSTEHTDNLRPAVLQCALYEKV